jgi:hypothetical protein
VYPVIVSMTHERLRRLAVPVMLPSSVFLSPAGFAAECQGEDGGSSMVVEIRGGDTLILEDGRAVRLFGALLPRRGAASDGASKIREDAERLIA